MRSRICSTCGTLGTALGPLLSLVMGGSFAHAQVRTYDVRWTNNAPTIDAVISPGEWDAAGPAEGNWGELRQPETDMDTANNRFQMMWDEEGLYVLYQVDQTAWLEPLGTGNPNISFGDDSLNLYFDPNTDDEPNFTNIPESAIDGYQFAFNQYLGTYLSTNADRQGVGVFTEAHIDAGFGDQAAWNQGGADVTGPAMQDIVVAQNNGPNGGIAEIFFPWRNFNADAPNPVADYNNNGTVDAADYTLWRDTLNETADPAGSGADGDVSGTVDQADYDLWKGAFGETAVIGTSGLYHPFAPENDDTWFLQMGQISTADPNNFLPVYNWTPSQFFTERPHAEITFVGRPGPASGGVAGVPEPASLVLALLAGGAMAVVRRLDRT